MNTPFLFSILLHSCFPRCPSLKPQYMFVLWLAHLEFLFYDHSHGTQGGFHSIQNTQWTSMITSFCLSFSKSISRNQEYNLRQDQVLSSLAKDGSDPCTYVAITRLQHDFRILLTHGTQKLKMFVYRNSKEQVFQGTWLPNSLNISYVFNKIGNRGKVTYAQSWMEFDSFN